MSLVVDAGPGLPDLFAGSSSLVAVTDLEDGWILYMNPTFQAFVGSRSGPLSELTIEGIFAVSGHATFVERLHERGSLCDHAERFRRADGAVRIVRLSAWLVEWEHRPAALMVGTDVTDHHAAPGSDTENIDRLALLADAASEGILLLEGDRCVDANAAVGRLTGFERTDIVGRVWSVLLDAPYAHAGGGALDACADGPQVVVARRKDGTTFPAEIELRANEHRCGGLSVLSIRDITRQRRAEEGAVAALEDMTALLNAMRNAVITIDDSGDIGSINEAGQELFGYAAAELVGGPVTALMPDDVAAHHQSYVDRYVRTGQRAVIGIGREIPARRKDGSTFDAHLSVNELPRRRGEPRRFIGSIIDISHLKRVEQGLRRSKRDLKRAQEVAGLGSWSYCTTRDAAGEQWMQWSGEVYRIFGLPLGEGRETRARYLSFVHPDDRDRVTALGVICRQ